MGSRHQFALFKTELIKKRRPWRSVEQVDFENTHYATLNREPQPA
jgi:hypothetical protein